MDGWLVLFFIVIGVWFISIFFGGRENDISLEFEKEEERNDRYGRGRYDYSTLSDLKGNIKENIKNMACPACGAHQLKGNGVIVKYGKVRFFQEEVCKGFFGGTKYKDVHTGSAYRVYGIYLYNAPGRALLNLFGAFSRDPGEIKCLAKGCNWLIKGGRGGTYSLNDIKNIIPKL